METEEVKIRKETPEDESLKSFIHSVWQSKMMMER